VRIAIEFELSSDKAILPSEGNRLVIEPVPKHGLLALLANWESLEDEFPEIADEPIKPEVYISPAD
jgi:antitoxin VapB